MDLQNGAILGEQAEQSLSPLLINKIKASAARAAFVKTIEHYDFPACCLAFATPLGMKLTGRHGIDVSFVEHPVDKKSILFHGVNRNLPIIIYDALKDERYCHDALVVGPPYARFFIVVPIMLSQHTCIGTLCLMDTKPRTFYSLQDCRFAMHAAEEIARCVGEASCTPSHLPHALQTFGPFLTLSRLPQMTCSMADTLASTPEVGSPSSPEECDWSF
mmetsp:Transcript_50448/g.100385  ORF Transcript_50448/g.100385 Transcript_50448/m.100385 type:complete len:218 (+) Transcript_50448:49-702(+)